MTDMKLNAITPDLLFDSQIKNTALYHSVCTATLELYVDGTPEPPWLGYLADIDGVLVGTCAFRSPPSAIGVEIAYFTFPEHEGKGYATKMVRQLLAIAREQGISDVFALTLPEINASNHILGKLGFARDGIAYDNDAGEVWRWRLR